MHSLEPWDEMPDHQHGLSKTFYKNYTPQLKYVEYIVYHKCFESEQKNHRRDTWYMQKPFCVKRNNERLFGLSGVHRWDPFLILPPSRWETALHTCTFLLLMFTPHRRLDMTGIVRSIFPFLSDMQWGINVSSVSGLFWLLSLDYMVRFWSEKKEEKNPPCISTHE